MTFSLAGCRWLLQKGNHKLGRTVYTFSLPAVSTCPGATALCRTHCYATKGHYHCRDVKSSLKRKRRALASLWFTARMIAEIHLRCVRLVRIHASGDFDSPQAVRKWAAIVRACPDTKFFAYTRSHRIPEIRSELVLLSQLSNIHVWWSTDRETGMPSRVPARVRVAYMSVDDDDLAPEADLIFRVFRGKLAKRLGGVLVCPVENGTHTNITCDKCRLCIDREPRHYRRLEEAS